MSRLGDWWVWFLGAYRLDTFAPECEIPPKRSWCSHCLACPRLWNSAYETSRHPEAKPVEKTTPCTVDSVLIFRVFKQFESRHQDLLKFFRAENKMNQSNQYSCRPILSKSNVSPLHPLKTAHCMTTSISSPHRKTNQKTIEKDGRYNRIMSQDASNMHEPNINHIK